MNIETTNNSSINNNSEYEECSNVVTLFHSNDESFPISLSGNCLNSLNFLNQELINLGFNSIFLNYEEFNLTSFSSNISPNMSSIDFLSLVITITEFIKRYRSQLPKLESLQEKCHRVEKDNELLSKRGVQLKEVVEVQKKEICSYEEKCRQFQIKVNKLNKSIKDDQEEIRKLKSLIDQRDTFYKHDRKKVDNEMFKLKEKLQQFITNKSQIYANIDLNETLNRNPAKQRATWNSDSSKKQMDVYTHLLKEYEVRLRDMVLENSDIKQTITNVVIKLSKLCKNLKISTNTNDIDEFIEKDNHEFIKNLPYETISSKLDEFLKIKFSIIEEETNKRKKKSSNFSEKDIENTLNTTFTIEHDEDDEESENLNNDSVNERSISKVNNSSINKDLSNQSTIEYFKNELKEYKQIIKSQNEMINSFSQNLSITNDKSISFIEVEANSIIEERTKLSEEKKQHYKQKLQFEEEKLRYNHALLQLAKQRKSFEEEKEGYYKAKLYDSYGKTKDLEDLNNSTQMLNKSRQFNNDNSIFKSIDRNPSGKQ